MEAGAAAVRRGADFLWSEYLTDGNGYYFHSGACGLVEPEDYDTEYISALLETRRDDGTTWRDYLNDGRGALVKATFEARSLVSGPTIRRGTLSCLSDCTVRRIAAL